MIRLKESIHVRQPVERVFHYVSQFTHIQAWDPGVESAQQIEPGRTGVGTGFDLTLKFGPFRPKMKYVITAYQPFSRMVLEGRGGSFCATDTICFEKTALGARVTYQADIRFSGLGRHAEPLLTPLLSHIGKRAVQGLKAALNGTVEPPDPPEGWRSGAGWIDCLADHAVVPGMILFSRLGYELSRRFWTEPAAALYGQKVILTGGTSGIGKAAAYEIAARKAFLTIIARNRDRANQVCQDIISRTGNPNVDYMIADLSLMSDIRQVAGEIRDRKKHIDILINNAGALFDDRKETAEGIERTFATDLLGVFCLTMQLADTLAASRDPRIINVSSGGMYTQKIEVDDLENSKGTYHGATAYARAKRGIVILTRLWAERFHCLGIKVHAMHPGWVDTPGIRRSLPRFYRLAKPILRTPQQGADTMVWLAASRAGGQSTGRFWLDRRPHGTVVLPGTGETGRERKALWEKLNAWLSGNA